MVRAARWAARGPPRKSERRGRPPPVSASRSAAMALLARSMGALSLGAPSSRRPTGLGSVAAVRGAPVLGGGLAGGWGAAGAASPPAGDARDTVMSPHCGLLTHHPLSPPHRARPRGRRRRGRQAERGRPRPPRRKGAPVQQGAQERGGDAHQEGAGREGGGWRLDGTLGRAVVGAPAAPAAAPAWHILAFRACGQRWRARERPAAGRRGTPHRPPTNPPPPPPSLSVGLQGCPRARVRGGCRPPRDPDQRSHQGD